MTFCSQLEDLDALVMGELDASHARELRGHAATCPSCAAELTMLTEERELFARRAAALDVLDPPRAMIAPPRTVAAARAERARRILPALGRIAMRGHFTAACAAALFVVVALSRVGTASMSMSMSINDGVVSMSADEGAAGSGMLASYREGEPLACSPGGLGTFAGSGSGALDAPGAMTRDDGVMTSSSSGASRGELLACVGGGGAGVGGAVESASGGASCEPSVTCSAQRQ